MLLFGFPTSWNNFFDCNKRLNDYNMTHFDFLDFEIFFVLMTAQKLDV